MRAATALIGSLTMGSRVLGFIRDVLFARFFFGAGLDAWALAFTVPNLFRRLFGEGALSSAFLPVFVKKLESGDTEGAGRFAGKVIGALAVVLAGIVGAGVVGCLVASFVVPGERAATILRLTSAMLPYAVLICLAAVFSAVLNAVRHFAVPAAAPMALNVVLIGAMLLFARSEGTGSLWVLVVAVLVGGMLQLGMQIAATRAKGLRITPSLDRDDDDIKLVVSRMMPAAMGLGVFQLNVLFDRIIAEAMVPGQGAVSALYLGNRIIQLPLALFAIAAATAAMPELSTCAARGDDEGMKKLVSDSVRSVLFWALPASAGLALLGEPVARFLFEYLGGGRFAGSPDAAARVGMVIAFYAGGLGAFAVTPILTRAFYARGDTKTPARVAVICVVVNLVLNLVLVSVFHRPPPAGSAAVSIAVSDWRFGTYGEAGLALASSVSFLLQAGTLAVLLWRTGGEPHGEWAAAAIEPIVAVAAAAATGWLLYSRFISFIYEAVLRPRFEWVQPGVIPWTRTVIAPVAGGAVFLVVIFWLIARRTREESVSALVGSSVRLGLSAAVMGALVHLVLWSLPPYQRSGWQPFDRAFFPVVAGFFFYWLLVSIFRVTEYEEFRGWDADDDKKEK